MQSEISASIVIYNSDFNALKSAIDSFLVSTSQSTLYLLDNSRDDRFRKHFIHPRIRYIYNGRNMGFGAAHNIALRDVLNRKAYRYHVVLNPDVFFHTEAIEKIYHFMEQNSNVALTMPKVLYPDGRLQPLCKLLPSPVTLLSRRFLSFHKPLIEKLNHHYELKFTGYDKIMDVPFLSGCFMFLRTDAIRKVGLFDESIFLYTEDTDLSRRLHAEFRTVFFPGAVIYHHNKRASYKDFRALTLHLQSAIRYFNKWGWFNDSERRVINQRVLLKLSE